MTMPEPNCPHCRERMEVGIMLDKSRNRIEITEWLEGTPETSFWTGLKTKGKARYTILSYRCPRCGLLQDYALK